MRFGEFVGNEAVKARLSADGDAGRFPHALLLEGVPGSGRRTLAMAVARAAVCRGQGEKPCGVCSACAKSVHPDVTVLGEEDRPLTVDTVRWLREEAYLLPNESAYRVMILVNAHAMQTQAQNALLKILEEPPAHVLFILTCDDRTLLLETVRSRCVCMTLTAVPFEQAAPLLRRRLPQQSEESLRQAHSLFGGTIGRVIDGVSDGTFSRVLELVPAMAAAVADTTEWTLIKLCGQLEKEKELTVGVLSGLQLVFRDALTLHYGGTAMLSTAPDTARHLCQRLTASRLMTLIQQVEQLQMDLMRNMNNTLFLTRLCACLRQAAGY